MYGTNLGPLRDAGAVAVAQGLRQVATPWLWSSLSLKSPLRLCLAFG